MYAWFSIIYYSFVLLSYLSVPVYLGFMKQKNKHISDDIIFLCIVGPLLWPLVFSTISLLAIYTGLERFGMYQATPKIKKLPKATAEKVPFSKPLMQHRLGKCDCGDCQVDKYRLLKR
jgi:hypothetical protein